MLFPEQKKQAEKLFYESCSKEKGLKDLDFDRCGQLLEQSLEQWLEAVDFASYDETGDLSITSDAADQYCTLAIASFPTVIGQKYRMYYDCAGLTASFVVQDLKFLHNSHIINVLR